ncbi:VOC family protein [Pseudomonas lopnurensis]|uniref:VOC family protein n=1 Tax=Pseudomonas lopnurensis TaxID=1477517 RepID=UPI0028A776DB|nr:VOC family protein [Pseudomonas lopnurensis]
MIAYVMLGSNDIPTSRAFYDPLMHLIGAEPRAGASDKRVSYAQAGGMPILASTRPYDEALAQAGNGVMVAFPVASRERVEEAYALALRLGAHDEGAPGVRSDQTIPSTAATFATRWATSCVSAISTGPRRSRRSRAYESGD